MDSKTSLANKHVDLASELMEKGKVFKLSLKFEDFNFFASSSTESAKAYSMENKGLMKRKSPATLRWNERRIKAFINMKKEASSTLMNYVATVVGLDNQTPSFYNSNQSDIP